MIILFIDSNDLKKLRRSSVSAKFRIYKENLPKNVGLILIFCNQFEISLKLI